eukprot:5520201-Prorocentrum_lima.AAC.1
MNTLRTQARCQPHEPIQADMPRQAVKTIPDKKAGGPDGWCPLQLKGLPDKALQSLTRGSMLLLAYS